MKNMLYSRLGDQDDYHEHDDLPEFIEFLRKHGVVGPFLQVTAYGLSCPGYRGQNYISAYWGSDVETPIRGLSGPELAVVRKQLRVPV